MACKRWVGNDSSGWTDGLASNAAFHTPTGLTVDTEGNTWVADYNNHCIRQVSPSGMVGTVAGVCCPGLANGKGASARFKNPQDVAWDNRGFVYVADRENRMIRKVTADGTVSTFATNGTSGDGRWPDERQAHLFEARGIAVHTDGSVFVADYGSVLKVGLDGAVSRIAGTADELGFQDGPGGVAKFGRIYGVSVDLEGHIFVADRDNKVVRKIAPDGVVSAVAGRNATDISSDGPFFQAAVFGSPVDVAVDVMGNIVVADHPDKVRLISRGSVTTLAAGLQDVWAVALTLDGQVIVGEGHGLSVIQAGLHPPPHLHALRQSEVADSLSVHFRGLLADSLLADVTFLVGKERIQAHRAILAARSAYFGAMFRSAFKEGEAGTEVEVLDTTPSAFRALLLYIYTGELEVDDEGLVEVVVLADKYDMDGLRSRCVRQVRRVLTASNAVNFLLAARKRGLERVRVGVMSFIRQHSVLIKAEAPQSLQLLKDHPDLAVELLEEIM